MRSLSAVSVTPVGVIHSRFTAVDGMPIQSVTAPDEPLRLEVFPEYAAGLRDIDGFEYLILLTHLHTGTIEPLEVIPFLDNRPRGVFATRAPARPNRIGLSIVKLIRVDGRFLDLSGNDVLDQTPVLDIKPYVPKFDSRDTTKVGWYSARLDELPRTKSDSRMSRPKP
jgi:tRNA-Thr(GGU) m(6)t(6)A37 methyltransferase TsaA